MNLLAEIRGRFAKGLQALGQEPAELVQLVLPSQDAKFGDYQANCAMPLGKRLGKPPRQIATDLVAALAASDLCETPEIAGPGFINVRLKNEWLSEQLLAAGRDGERLGIAPVAKPRTYIVDYSSPNVAKPMHVGHIRSTVIGDALYHVLQFLGHKTISDNHIGDWGTQFGMIIYGFKNFLNEAALEQDPVGELSRLYKYVNQLASDDAERK